MCLEEMKMKLQMNGAGASLQLQQENYIFDESIVREMTMWSGTECINVEFV